MQSIQSQASELPEKTASAELSGQSRVEQSKNLLLSVSNVSLIRGQRLLFKNLNFSLCRGQVIHLSGANGTGKTSLFKLITNTLAPTAGEIELTIADDSAQNVANVVDVTNVTRADFSHTIYLGHKTAIKNELTVAENIMLNSAIFDGVVLSESLILEVLQQVNLVNFKNQLASKLSAGQKRRVMLSRLWSVANYKAIWLLDEPLTALDALSIASLQQRIDEYLLAGGAVIFTSHQPLILKHEVIKLELGVTC